MTGKVKGTFYVTVFQFAPPRGGDVNPKRMGAYDTISIRTPAWWGDNLAIAFCLGEQISIRTPA